MNKYNKAPQQQIKPVYENYLIEDFIWIVFLFFEINANKENN